MTNIKHFLGKHSLLLVGFLLSFPSSALANPTAIAGLQTSGATVQQNKKTGKVTFIGSNSPQGIKLSSNVPILANNPQEQARNFVRAYAPLFGVNNPDTDLVARKSFTLDAQSTVKYQQIYNNIPVIGAEINVNLDSFGNLLAMTGESASSLNLNTTPKVSAAQALSTALKVVRKAYNLSASSVNATTPELRIYQPGIIDPGTGLTRLVWYITVTPKTPQPVEQIVLVDAKTADKVVLSFNNAPDARSRQTYTANHTTILPGTIVCSEASTDANCTTTGTSDVAKAHLFAADTYNFYLNNHARDSIDGLGLPIISTVQYDNNYANAFWNGSQMVYGDGLSQADDVVGHELTHGVTQYTSNLYYYYQSGAINESFSDVWGEFIDLTNGKGNDNAAVRWKVGEDVPASIFGGPLRDMKNPTLFSNPDKMTSSYYVTDSSDNGGVHTNSGINNKATFLMTDGGTFNGKTITGLGITKVAKIYYKAQTTLLTSGSGYNDLYNALYQSCQSQVGTAGITASDCSQVQNATLAVEMNKQPVPGFLPQATVCSAGKTPKNLFFDNLEASTKWQFIKLTTASNSWKYDTGFAASGTTSLYGEDMANVSDSVAVMKTGVTIPAGAFLHFKHAFDFETDSFTDYDGGVLEYSVGNSNVWQDAKTLFAAGQNYNGTLDNTSGNPISGRAAFANVSHGYVSSRYNLATLAGKSVKFRFRQASDEAVGSTGWVVDDVRIYTCQ